MTTPQERREQFTFDLEQESDTKLARIIFEERPGLSGIITEKMGVQFGNTSSQKVDFYATPANKEKFREVFNKLSGIVASDVHLNKKHINAIIDEVMGLSKTAGDFKTAANNSNGKVTPRNDNQKTFLSKINDNQVIFGIGPAGTGKTLMACHAAVEALKTKQIKKIFLARPAVDTEEDLGALPGDIRAKLSPFMQPLYDELQNALGCDLKKINDMMDTGIIEIAPVGKMRGRTFQNAYIILDEAQNCTFKQLKMALTRIGDGSKMIVVGDPEQIDDLPRGRESGLSNVLDMVKTMKATGVNGVDIQHFTNQDIVRCEIVKSFVDAFDKKEKTMPKVMKHNHG